MSLILNNHYIFECFVALLLFTLLMQSQKLIKLQMIQFTILLPALIIFLEFILKNKNLFIKKSYKIFIILLDKKKQKSFKNIIIDFTYEIVLLKIQKLKSLY